MDYGMKRHYFERCGRGRTCEMTEVVSGCFVQKEKRGIKGTEIGLAIKGMSGSRIIKGVGKYIPYNSAKA